DNTYYRIKMTTEKPWHTEFPEPKAEAAIMPRNRVMQMLSLRGVASLLIIDLRRMDFEGGCLRGSLNIPAQGFWWNRGMLTSLRCMEFIDAAGDEQMQSMVLEGGVKGWVKSGPQFTRLMDGYKESYWQDLFAQEEAKKAAAQGQDDKNSVGQGDVTK
ncbi:unnamed protein product, partial [Aureobasidium uvarum]